jgi:hypothetical protein
VVSDVELKEMELNGQWVEYMLIPDGRNYPPLPERPTLIPPPGNGLGSSVLSLPLNGILSFLFH